MEIADVLKTATLYAGNIIQSHFNGSFDIAHKEGINNLVTEIDLLCEQKIIATIKQFFPQHSIISEESGKHIQHSEYQWIIDPIDGTVNFAHGIPLCCVSIGVLHNNELLCGAVYNPMMNEFFYAHKGQGATLNGNKISVSSKTDFDKACLVTGFPYKWPDDSKEHPIKVFERFIQQGLPVRRLGSAAIDLCWVACGRFDGFWEYNLSPWDVAAGYLIVEEAGGKVSAFNGSAYSVYDKETLATNGHIHQAMLDKINNSR
ncbi:MAG: inositol monophosphatase [Chitinophagia bacterium]|nr:inositol monophosphatase [Chitinophagia bacterium]